MAVYSYLGILPRYSHFLNNMTNLRISSFNLALFQRPKKPLPDEDFSQVCSKILSYFSFADQISNPILTARRKPGGEIFINPIFVQFTNIKTEDFESDIKMTKDIATVYFSRYKTKKISQAAIRLVSIINADFVENERKLIKNESFTLLPNNIKALTSKGEVKIGIRLVFQRNAKRYDLKIEPYFKHLACNYIDFNVVTPNLEASLNQVYDLFKKEKLFFTKNISAIMA